MIGIELQDEDGKTLESFDDPSAIFALLDSVDADGSACVRFIDAYGDTTFNRLQIPVLTAELRSRLLRLRGEAHRRAGALVAFVEQARDRPHVYVKFIGD